VLETAERVRKELTAAGIRTHLDARDGMKPGAKYYEWEGRGVPMRLEIGPRDVAAGTAMLARRTGGKKESLPLAGLATTLNAAMEAMQKDLLETARARREANSIRGATKEQFLAQLEAGGGFAYSGFCGRVECEMEIKEKTKATIRVLPDEEFGSPQVPATCMWCGLPTVTEALWARAY
jgi:prolyl-tRNA synthetase